MPRPRRTPPPRSRRRSRARTPDRGRPRTRLPRPSRTRAPSRRRSRRPTRSPRRTPHPTPVRRRRRHPLRRRPRRVAPPEPSDEPSEEPGRGGGTGDGPASDGDGNDADKDSSPTSTVDTPRENWRNGRPLAAEGLDLQPKRIRPGHEIPALVLAQASLRANPVIELRFPRWSGSGRGVKPTSARVVSSTDGPSTATRSMRYGRLRRTVRDLGEGETRLVRLKLLMR